MYIAILFLVFYTPIYINASHFDAFRNKIDKNSLVAIQNKGLNGLAPFVRLPSPTMADVTSQWLNIFNFIHSNPQKGAHSNIILRSFTLNSFTFFALHVDNVLLFPIVL